jgi:Trp operon repressor
LHQLTEIFRLPRNREETAQLLDGLLTPQEMEEFVKRWRLLLRLMAKQPQRRISRELGISLGTISRGSRLLKYGPVAFRTLVERSVQVSDVGAGSGVT